MSAQSPARERYKIAMKTGLLTIAGACFALSLLVGCSGGGDNLSAVPSKGADLCTQLNKTDRMRFSVGEIVESPKQDNPPADSTGTGGYSILPSQPSFRLETNYAGTFVKPDRFDYQLSGAPGDPNTPAIRSIRIGDNQWYLLNKNWVPQSKLSPFIFTPANLCDAFVAPLDLTGKTATPENVDGTDAQHIHIEGAQTAVADKLFGKASDHGKLLTSWDVDLWLNKDFRLIKAQAVSKAKYPYGRDISSTLAFSASSFNDDSIPDINQPI